MKNIILCWIVCFGFHQAFARDVWSSGESLWSSEEEADENKESEEAYGDISLVKSDISLAEENPQESFASINGIQELLRKLWSSKEDTSEEFDIPELRSAENTIIGNEDENKDVEMSVDDSSESRKEPNNVIWTYVLWHPEGVENNGPLLPQLSDYPTYNYLKNLLESGFQTQEEEGRQGWRDDRQQLDLPRVEALTSKDEPDIYDNMKDSFDIINEEMHKVASTPEFKQNMFYILFGVIGFLMLTIINDNFMKKREPKTVQDHYMLADKGAAASLPTYEECIKADRNIMVTMNDTDVFNKVDLSLPLVAVDTEVKEEEEK